MHSAVRLHKATLYSRGFSHLLREARGESYTGKQYLETCSCSGSKHDPANELHSRRGAGYGATSVQLVWLCLLVLTLSIGAGAQNPPALTQTRVFTPFNSSGDLVVGLAVTGEAKGSCQTNSAASPQRPDAWRCSADNIVLDPYTSSASRCSSTCWPR